MNQAMIAAEIKPDEVESVELLGCSIDSKSGVFDEPSMPSARLCSQASLTKRDLKFPIEIKPCNCEISLAAEGSSANGKWNGNGNGSHQASRPLCFAIRVRDVTRMRIRAA